MWTPLPGENPGAQSRAGSVTGSAASSMLTSVFFSAQGGGSLLPIIAAQSRSLIATSATLTSEYMRAHTRGPGEEDADTIASALVRLTASHLMLPLDPPGRRAERPTRIAVRAVRGP